MLKKISVTKIKTGMTIYVNKPWFKTPYLYKSIKISSKSDVKSLLRFSDDLYIKFEKNALKDVTRSMSFLKTVIDDLSESNLINNKSLTFAVNNLVSTVVNNPGIGSHIREEMQHQPLLFKQSVRLLTLSSAFGKELGLTQTKLRMLAKTAFLMDIGLLKMPQILNSKSLLSNAQRSELGTHCRIAAKKLKMSNVEPDVIMGVLAHHENLDGSGYPLGLSNKEIPLFARILRILNIYEAITGERPHQSKANQQYAIEQISAMVKNNKLDRRLVEKFCMFLRVYPIDTYVLSHLRHIHRVKEHLARDTISTINYSTNVMDRLLVYEIRTIHFESPIYGNLMKNPS